MTTLQDIITEFQNYKNELLKKISCDEFNGISNVADNEKVALINKMLNRLTDYQNQSQR